jgi:hypothetical protein
VNRTERELFTTLIAMHPNFLEAQKWEEGPDPPDVIVTDRSGRRIGVELTEWLIPEQTTHSITLQQHEMNWRRSLDTEHHARPKNFGLVQITFRDDTRYVKRDEAAFQREFYSLIEDIDKRWEEEFGGTPQKLWNDFSKYPTLGQHVQAIWFYDHPRMQGVAGATGWVTSEARGGAYDPKWASEALHARIAEKINKQNYTSLKSEQNLSELVLVVHYGILGILHNSPFEGVGRHLDDVIAEVRSNLTSDHGPFDRVFLYLAFNEGSLDQLYP